MSVGSYFDLQTPLGIAHRGGSLEHLENTASAFHHAIDLGYTVIETDIQVTRDGVMVVHHDRTTARTSRVNIDIPAESWSRLSTVQLLNGDAILRFEELLELVGPQVYLNLDPKTDEAGQSLAQFLQANPQLRERLCVGSFSTRRLISLRERIPGLKSSLGSAEMVKLMLAFVSGRKFVASSGVCAIQIPPRAYGISLTNSRFIDYVHEQGLDVHVWTIDEEHEMRRLYALGVDAVMTDRPTLLKKVLTDLRESGQ